jgi:hypothetical protein
LTSKFNLIIINHWIPSFKTSAELVNLRIECN